MKHDYIESPTGIFYNKDTNPDIIDVLDRAYLNKTRVRLWYGDITENNNVNLWHEDNDIIGSIGRSSGKIKIPLLIKSKRSIGGGSILDNRIVAIKSVGSKQWLYRHDDFMNQINKYFERNGIICFGSWTHHIMLVNFKLIEQAQRFKDFMCGDRMSK